MSSRETILAKVRKSLDGDTADRKAQAMAHINSRPRHPRPDRVTNKTPRELRTLFREQLEAVQATVEEVADAAAIPELIANYLRQHNLPPSLRMGADADLANLAWETAPTLEIHKGRAEDTDAVGLSKAASGVAETGTLVLASGADNPVTVTFMPETHIVVVDADQIVASYEDAYDTIRQRFGGNQMPRTVNMVSGPSRTGDIGGRIVMGAHGPRRMLVIVAGELADETK